SKIGLIITLKNAWTTSRRVNFLWVANFNLKFGFIVLLHFKLRIQCYYTQQKLIYTKIIFIKSLEIISWTNDGTFPLETSKKAFI
ncbi:hypothetical protein, partial [Streptococcus thermophilus]|uniref:hypothetical protein n=1 Tax=Streptococcus thermophilus TaxID=1308 RepID=UPI0021A334E1